MRKAIPFLLLLLPLFTTAQDTYDWSDSTRGKGFNKNAVKVNLSSLAFRNYHIQYERQIAKKLSLNLGFRYMPDGGLPMESFIRDQFPSIFDNQYVDIGKFTVGNFSITPELRWYLSRRAMKGFYIAPYGRYTSFDLGLPLKYTYDSDPGPAVNNVTRTAVFNGTVTSFSGGIMFGTQFSLGRRIVLDIWWLGGHYGSSNGDLTLTPDHALSSEEQSALQSVIDGYKDDIPLFEYERVGPVTATGAKIKSTGPWGGIRALGINLGFRF